MDKKFKGLRPIKPEEKTKTGSKDTSPGKKLCSSCHNEANQFAMFDSQGVTCWRDIAILAFARISTLVQRSN